MSGDGGHRDSGRSCAPLHHQAAEAHAAARQRERPCADARSRRPASGRRRSPANGWPTGLTSGTAERPRPPTSRRSIAGLSTTISEVIPEAGARAVARMRATGTPEQDVDILADLFAEALAAWPDDLWLVFDDYQFAMEAKAPERFVDGLLRRSPVKLLLTSRKRPKWASARRLLYGEIYELGRNELAMDHDEAAAVLAHRKDAPAAGLVALAEGWPAVIGLAALTDELELPEGSLPDTLYEYLAEELYQAATPEVQRQLCRLAVAPSLADGVAEFLLGSATGDILKEGMRLGFLSTRAHGLEIHPLLRTFLRRKAAELAAGHEADAESLAYFLIEPSSLGRSLATESELLASDEFFVDLMEQGLPLMLAEARMPTRQSVVGLRDC